MTAIAAAIALSSTPLLAQSAEPAATDAAPVIAAPAAPATSAPAASPAPVMAPVVHEPEAAAPDVAAATPTRATPRAATRGAAVRTARAAPAPKAIAPTPAAGPSAPVAVASTPVAAPPAPSAAPAASAAWDAPSVAAGPAPAQSPDNQSDNRLIELAGVAGAGLLVLGGGALLFERRRKAKRDDEVGVYEPLVEPGPAAPPEFAPAFFTGSPDPATLPPDRPLTEIPDDVDTSELGPHMQAAYRGPTPDNPSLSLKKRLKRARFFDERDRQAGAQPAESNASAEAMIAHARAAREAHDEEQPVFWPHDRKDAETRQAFQS
jgi:hypothetical protein